MINKEKNMLKKNFLTLGMMSLLLSSTLFGNEKVACSHCFASLPTQETSVEVVEEVVVPKTVVEVASYPEEIEILPLVQTVLNETEAEKSLPISTHFCGNNEVPVYEEGSEVFTCM